MPEPEYLSDEVARAAEAILRELGDDDVSVAGVRALEGLAAHRASKIILTATKTEELRRCAREASRAWWDSETSDARECHAVLAATRNTLADVTEAATSLARAGCRT